MELHFFHIQFLKVLFLSWILISKPETKDKVNFFLKFFINYLQIIITCWFNYLQSNGTKWSLNVVYSFRNYRKIISRSKLKAKLEWCNWNKIDYAIRIYLHNQLIRIGCLISTKYFKFIHSGLLNPYATHYQIGGLISSNMFRWNISWKVPKTIVYLIVI